VSEWDLLDDEPDVPEEVPGTTAPDGLVPESDDSPWDFVGEEPPADGYGGGSAWPDPDETPEEPRSAPLPPEFAAAQLKDGQVVWALVNGQTVTLGRGQQLRVPAGVPDGIGGWRRVRITDAASLRAEVLEFQLEQPVQGVADDPVLTFPPAPIRPAPQRPEGFPVGQGGALTAAFESKVRDARQQYLRNAQEARQEYLRKAEEAREESEHRIRRFEQDYEQRALVIQRQAEAQKQEVVQRIHASATQQVREARAAQARAEQERDEARVALAMAQQELDKSWWRRLGRGAGAYPA
jgi:hypothetical protein